MRRLLWTIGGILALCGALWWSSVRSVRPMTRARAPAPVQEARDPAFPRLREAAREPAETPGATPTDVREAVPRASEAVPHLAPGHTPFLAGRVLRPDGQPAAADVVAYDAGDQPSLSLFDDRSAVQRSKGRFRIQPLTGEGPYRVVATMGELFAEVEGVVAGTSDLELRLEGGLALEGTVVSERGRPVPRFEVRGYRQPARFGRALRAPGREGAFTLQGLDPGAWRLRVEAPGFVQTGEVEVDVPATEPVVLEMTPAARLAGVVVDLTGAPVPHAGITATSEGFHKLLSSGDSGSFTLTGLAPGEWKLEASHATAGSGRTFRRTLASGEGVEGVELVIGPLARVQGTVVGLDGLPLADVHVTALDPGAKRFGTESDDAGRFTLEDLDPGRVQLAAVIEGLHVQREVEVAAGATVEVLMDPPRGSIVRVEGRIELDGRPLARARAALTPARGDVLRPESQSWSPVEEGLTTLRAAVAGSYRLQLDRGDFQHEWTLEIPQVESHVLDLGIETATVEGLVVDVDGQPVSGARVDASLLAENGESHRTLAITGPTGGLTLRVAAGRTQLRARNREGTGRAEREIVTAPGQRLAGVVLIVE